MPSEYTLLVIMLIFDAAMGIVVPLEFGLHEYRYYRERRATVSAAAGTPQPPPRRWWPAIALLSAVAISGLMYLVYIARPQDTNPYEEFIPNAETINVTGKHFDKEDVVLDNHRYYNCIFEDVTFIYSGGYYFMSGDQIVGKFAVKIDSQRATNVLNFLVDYGVFSKQPQARIQLTPTMKP